MEVPIASPATAPETEAAPAGGLGFMLRALQYRNYRLFFVGQGVSLIGSWLTTTATSWLVYRLASGNPLVKAATVRGIVRFSAQIPTFLVAPLAGVLVDRMDRHRVIVITQVLSLLQSATLAWLALSHRITIPDVIVLNAFQGFVNAFDAPARQAYVVEMIERREDLPNAIALNSSMFNGARLIGPAVAGLLIAATSEGVCFLIDAISYFAVIVALLMMQVKRSEQPIKRKHPLHELYEGIQIRVRLSTRARDPVVGRVDEYFRERLSNADAAVRAGAGAAIAWRDHLRISRRGRGRGRAGGRDLPGIAAHGRRAWASDGALSGFLLGGSMAWFAVTHSLALALVLAAISGIGSIISFAAGNTMLQALVDDHMRGRLMAFYIMSVMGTAPLGSLVGGWLATPEVLGVSRTVELAGALSVVTSLWFMLNLPALRRFVRPIYVKKGIIPEVAASLQQAEQATTPPEQ